MDKPSPPPPLRQHGVPRWLVCIGPGGGRHRRGTATPAKPPPRAGGGGGRRRDLWSFRPLTSQFSFCALRWLPLVRTCDSPDVLRGMGGVGGGVRGHRKTSLFTQNRSPISGSFNRFHFLLRKISDVGVWVPKQWPVSASMDLQLVTPRRPMMGLCMAREGHQ